MATMKPKTLRRHEALPHPIFRGRRLFTGVTRSILVTHNGRPLGKEGATFTGRYIWSVRSKYMPHQGAQECARRVRQGAPR